MSNSRTVSESKDIQFYLALFFLLSFVANIHGPILSDEVFFKINEISRLNFEGFLFRLAEDIFGAKGLIYVTLIFSSLFSFVIYFCCYRICRNAFFAMIFSILSSGVILFVKTYSLPLYYYHYAFFIFLQLFLFISSLELKREGVGIGIFSFVFLATVVLANYFHFLIPFVSVIISFVLSFHLRILKKNFLGNLGVGIGSISRKLGSLPLQGSAFLLFVICFVNYVKVSREPVAWEFFPTELVHLIVEDEKVLLRQDNASASLHVYVEPISFNFTKYFFSKLKSKVEVISIGESQTKRLFVDGLSNKNDKVYYLLSSKGVVDKSMANPQKFKFIGGSEMLRYNEEQLAVDKIPLFLFKVS